MDRIFVPLTTECFDDFEARGKRWEVRRLERHWNEKNVRTGRHATLSHGYSKGRRIEGTVGRIVTGSLEKIMECVPLHAIEPRAKTKREAIQMNLDTLGEAESYIAFEICF